MARIGDDLSPTPEEREKRIPSGTATMIASRIHRAKTFLKQAGLLSRPKRGVVEITDRGREVLSKNPEKIDVALLSSSKGIVTLSSCGHHTAGGQFNTPAEVQRNRQPWLRTTVSYVPGLYNKAGHDANSWVHPVRVGHHRPVSNSQ